MAKAGPKIDPLDLDQFPDFQQVKAKLAELEARLRDNETRVLAIRQALEQPGASYRARASRLLGIDAALNEEHPADLRAELSTRCEESGVLREAINLQKGEVTRIQYKRSCELCEVLAPKHKEYVAAVARAVAALLKANEELKTWLASLDDRDIKVSTGGLDDWSIGLVGVANDWESLGVYWLKEMIKNGMISEQADYLRGIALGEPSGFWSKFFRQDPPRKTAPRPVVATRPDTEWKTF